MNLFNMTSQFFLKGNKRKFLLFILLFINVYVVQGQAMLDKADVAPSVFPPSPNVIQLTKYLDQPMSFSSGTPQIGIPVYVIESGDIKIPVNLDYHAGGIKVSQEASNVGLGWSLNAGGVVSREIRGIIDDYYIDNNHNPFGGVMHATTTLKDIAQMNEEEYHLVDFYAEFKQIDFELDLFNYSIPSGGSQFVFNQDDRKFHEFEKSNKKIEYKTDTVGRIYEWTVTDTNGIRYIFGEISEIGAFGIPLYSETSQRATYGSNSILQDNQDPIGITSWYLRTVRDKNGNEVSFEYGTNNDVEYANRVPQYTDRALPGLGAVYTISKVKEKYLQKITFKGGSINFEYSSRLDLKNSSALKKIKINRLNPATNQNELLKEINLGQSYYDYIVTTGSTHPSNQHNYNRLKLDSVVFKNNISEDEMVYKLEYDPTPLPQKFSYAQDYWGGYNGKNENFSLIPPATFYDFGGPLNFNSHSVERHVDKDYVKAGILNKIIYPTGGYTRYHYEPNTASAYTYLDGYYNVPEIFFVKNIKNPYKEYEFSFQYNVSTGGNNCSLTQQGNNFLWKFSCPFTVQKPLQADFITNSYNQCPEGSSQTIENYFPDVTTDEVICNFRNPKFEYPNGNPVENWMLLAPGNYNMTVEFNGNPYLLTPVQGSAGLIVDLYVREDETPDIRVVGGLRVNEIENYDRDNTIISKRKFQYEFIENGQLLSTGNTMLPRFGLYEPMYIANVINYHTSFDRFIYYMSDFNLNPFANGSVAYEKVKETFVDDSNPNKNYSKNYTHSNSIFRYYNNPYRPEALYLRNFTQMQTQWNTTLKLEENLNSSGNIASHTSYSNPLNTTTDKKIFAGFRVQDMSLSLGANNVLSSKYIMDYHHYSSYAPLVFQESVENLSTGIITNREDFKYEGINPLLVSSQTTTNSLGETLRTDYSYPQDGLHWQTGIMNQMIEKNMISTPVIVKTYNNGTIISEQLTEYQVVNTDQILPHHVYAKKGSNTLEKKITYNSYDARGNLTQYTLENGTPVSIIWGYNGQYPIAKVEGKTYTEITTLAQALITDSNSTYGLEPAFFDNLRNLTGAIVTCYIYKPLVGVTTIIQPNGQKETYEYDGSGRLMQVKDHNGAILKKMDYHYKNQ